MPSGQRAGAPALRVAVHLEGPGGVRRREIGYAPGVGRRLSVDGEPARSLAAWRAWARTSSGNGPGRLCCTITPLSNPPPFPSSLRRFVASSLEASASS